jgi:DNA-binding ferritin-like protein
MSNVFESQYNEIEIIFHKIAEHISELAEKAIGAMKDFLEEATIKEATK